MSPKTAKQEAAPSGDAALHGLPGHLIRRCHQISVALFLEECADQDVTPIQFAVLSLLREYGSMDQITLAGYAALNRSTTGEVVGRLEARGLLERGDNPDDRRVRLLQLSTRGARLLDRLEVPVQRVQERILAPLSPAERGRFIDCLERIATANNEFSRAPLRHRPPNDKEE